MRLLWIQAKEKIYIHKLGSCIIIIEINYNAQIQTNKLIKEIKTAALPT